MFVSAIFITLIVLALSLFYRKRKRGHDFFRGLGIPGPSPHWLYGSYWEIAKSSPHLMYQKWTKQFGRTYGYYEGSQAILVTSDPVLLKDIFIKNFSSLHGRKLFPIQRDPDAEGHVSMFMARGQRWKRLRSIVNPTFSNAKMKQMSVIISNCVDILMSRLQTHSEKNETVDIYRLFQGLTMHVIAEAAFGMQTKAQTDPGDFFLNTTRSFFEMLGKKRSIVEFASITPELRKLYFMLASSGLFRSELLTNLMNALKKVIDMRRDSSEANRVDLLQLMLEAEEIAGKDETNDDMTMNLDDDEENENSTEVADKGANSKSNASKNRLSIGEIQAQSFLFLTAGYETTSNALGYCAYHLALNAHVQEKLLAEIDEYIGHERPSYERVHGLKYLDMVLSETLRLHPIAGSFVNRLVMEPCIIGGYSLPPGVAVQADVWSLHRDPDLWGPDPETFDPDRFNQEEKKNRHSMAWMPFGAGPRNCIGMRFALMEAKLTLVTILQKYEILRCDETEVPLTVKEAATVSPLNGIRVRLQQR